MTFLLSSLSAWSFTLHFISICCSLYCFLGVLPERLQSCECDFVPLESQCSCLFSSLYFYSILCGVVIILFPTCLIYFCAGKIVKVFMSLKTIILQGFKNVWYKGWGCWNGCWHVSIFRCDAYLLTWDSASSIGTPESTVFFWALVYFTMDKVFLAAIIFCSIAAFIFYYIYYQTYSLAL